MSSEVEICNRALQKLGAARITSLTDKTTEARECSFVYPIVRDAELRAHVWNFARSRAVLAPSTTKPLFDFDEQFPLPADFLRLHPLANVTDWQIENGNILTNDGNIININYIKRVIDPNDMDILFREALSARIALELTEKITESNTKKSDAMSQYIMLIRQARQVNAIENLAHDAMEDPYITARL